jgi:hypothetical protein
LYESGTTLAACEIEPCCVDRFEQADAGVAEKGAELGIDLEFAAQAMGVHQSRNVIIYTAKAAAPPGVAKQPRNRTAADGRYGCADRRTTLGCPQPDTSAT